MTSIGKTNPPWTEEQVKNLNEFQTAGRWHPFTCPSEHADDKERVLVADVVGWTCPECSYTQDWAYAFMADDHSISGE